MIRSARAASSVIAPVILLALPVVVSAQPAAGTVFVTGSAAAVIEQVATQSGSGFEADRDGGGIVAGGALGLGVHLTPRVSARVEWSGSGSLKRESNSSAIGLPYMTVFGADLTLPAPPIVDQRFSSSRKAQAVFSLLGYHLPAGRATVEVMAGLGFVRQATSSSYEYTSATFGGLVIPPARQETRFVAWGTAAVAGLDVAVSLSRHAALVAGVRAHELGGTLSVRPGLGLRWIF